MIDAAVAAALEVNAMCLAIPMRLISREGNLGVAEIGGVRTDVRLDIVEAEVGQSLIVHAGFAIQVLDEKEAEDQLAILRDVLGPVEEPGPIEELGPIEEQGPPEEPRP